MGDWDWNWDGPWHLGGAEWVFWLLGAAAQILFWGVVIFLVIQLFRRAGSHPPHSGSHALRILEERYARGEISREEYQERRAVLEGSPPAGT